MIMYNDDLDRDVYINLGFEITLNDLRRVIMFHEYEICGLKFIYEDHANYGLILIDLSRFKKPVFAYFDKTVSEIYTFVPETRVKMLLRN